MALHRYKNVQESIKKLCAPEISEKIKPVWGLDGEYELNSVWRDCGVDKMWILFGMIEIPPNQDHTLNFDLLGSHAKTGNIGNSRYHSSFVALQIKAMKEGIFTGERYSL